MKARNIKIEVTNLTLKEGNIFFSYQNTTFDKAYKAVKKEMKMYEFIIENVKCDY